MTITTEISKLQENLANAYSTTEEKGATLPANQNFDNLATAISSIPSGTTPTGTLSITVNGVYDVTNYASADVSVSGGGILLTVTNLVSGTSRIFYLTLGNNNAWNYDPVSTSIQGSGHSYSYNYYTFVWNIEPNTDYTLFSFDGMHFERERLINISENTFLSFSEAEGGSIN